MTAWLRVWLYRGVDTRETSIAQLPAARLHTKVGLGFKVRV